MSHETGRPTADRAFDVAITGAFFTGCPLRVDIDNYRTVQTELITALARGSDDSGWAPAPGDPPSFGTYASGGGFAANVPLVLACRTGDDTLGYTRQVLDDRSSQADGLPQAPRPDWRIVPTGMLIEVYDVGVGVIDGTFNVAVPRATSTRDFANGIKEIVGLHLDAKGQDRSAVAATLRQLCEETAQQFREAVEQSGTPARLDPWLLPPGDVGRTGHWRRWRIIHSRSRTTSTSTPSSEWGRLLWLHPVHLLAGTSDKARMKQARRVAPVVSRTMKVQGGLFVPGIGASAIVTADGRRDHAVLKLVHLHWAYYALHMEIDRGLLLVLNRIDTAGVTRVHQRELESEAAEAFDWYARVTQARVRVDSALAGLGGDEQAIWDQMCEVQKYETLVKGVDRKVDALRTITDRRAQEASSAQARRATRSLGLLTALGLVSLVIASFGYFFGAAVQDTDRGRVYPFAIGFAVALAIWWWINFAKLRRGAGRRSARRSR